MKRFNIYTKIIVFIITIAFLWQNIVWAYPDTPSMCRASLVQITLARDRNKAAAFRRFAAAYITNAIFRHPNPTLTTVRNTLPEIHRAALRHELPEKDMPVVEDDTVEGFIRIIFSDTNELLFCNPKVYKETTPSTLELPINEYLRIISINRPSPGGVGAAHYGDKAFEEGPDKSESPAFKFYDKYPLLQKYQPKTLIDTLGWLATNREKLGNNSLGYLI